MQPLSQTSIGGARRRRLWSDRGTTAGCSPGLRPSSSPCLSWPSCSWRGVGNWAGIASPPVLLPSEIYRPIFEDMEQINVKKVTSRLYNVVYIYLLKYNWGKIKLNKVFKLKICPKTMNTMKPETEKDILVCQWTMFDVIWRVPSCVLRLGS